MSGGRPWSPRRFRSLAIHVLASGIDPRLLWDVMFRIDMESYRQTGKSVTGAVWVKTEDGVEPRKSSKRKKAK